MNIVTLLVFFISIFTTYFLFVLNIFALGRFIIGFGVLTILLLLFRLTKVATKTLWIVTFSLIFVFQIIPFYRGIIPFSPELHETIEPPSLRFGWPYAFYIYYVPIKYQVCGDCDPAIYYRAGSSEHVSGAIKLNLTSLVLMLPYLYLLISVHRNSLSKK